MSSIKNDNSVNILTNRVLSVASIFEGSFSGSWIASIVEEETSLVESVLVKAIEKGIVRSESDGFYLFDDLKKKNELISNLRDSDRKRIFRKFLDFVLNKLDASSKPVPHLSPMVLCGFKDLDGCVLLQRAAELYLNSFFYEQALLCYRTSLRILSSIRGRKAELLYIQVALSYSKIAVGKEELKELQNIVHNALRKATRCKKESYYALLKMHEAKNEWLSSNYEKAMQKFDQAWAQAQRLNDPWLQRAVNTFTTFFLFWQGRFVDAVNHYEKTSGSVDDYPKEQFPIFAKVAVGRCYTLIGQVSHGLGMLMGLQRYVLKKGDGYMAAHTTYTIGATMLDIRRLDDAIRLLQLAFEYASQYGSGWVIIRVKLMLALAFYLKGQEKLAASFLEEHLRESKKTQVTVRPYPYLLELAWAIEQGRLSPVRGCELKKEIADIISGKNVFMKGIAHRYNALFKKMKGFPHREIVKSLNQSLIWLRQSGNQIEIARTHAQLARQYLDVNDIENAEREAKAAYKVYRLFDPNLLPNELRKLINEADFVTDLFGDTLEITLNALQQEGELDAARKILGIANDLIKAERGGLFLGDVSDKGLSVRLKISKNLTVSDINEPNFQPSTNLIKEVIQKGEPKLLERDFPLGISSDISKSEILDKICVPVELRGKVIGAMYHDSPFLHTQFKEHHKKLLCYLSSLIAIILDNAKAHDKIQSLGKEILELSKEDYKSSEPKYCGIVGKSPAILEVIEKIKMVGQTDTAVLLLGETGVGKDLIARAIHQESPRRNKPFVVLQCTTIPDNLLSSELFGFEKGAFTGATQRRLGKFELADGGTIYLDEVGDLPLDMQAKLLRVLESKEFERLGGNETIYSDFRLIAATNRDLAQKVKEGMFRADLFFRLQTFPIIVPPLRDRKEDIPILANFFLRYFSSKIKKTFDCIPQEEMTKLIQYEWPGNVRELKSIIERAVILSNVPYLCIPELSFFPCDSAPYQDSCMSLEEYERYYILSTLEKTGWKVRGPGGAAELLALNPSTLEFRMKKLGIKRPKGIPKRKGPRSVGVRR